MKEQVLSPEALEAVSRIFKALCEPIRLKILQQLQLGEKCVSELCDSIKTSQPNISKHLKILTDTQLLQRRQEANLVYYSISDPMVYELCETICNGIQKRLEAQIAVFSPRSEKKVKPKKYSRIKIGA